MLGTIFADPSAAQELLNNAPRSVLEKIRDFISELLDTISAAARRITGAKDLAALTELEGWAQDMAKMLDKAMSETGRRTAESTHKQDGQSALASERYAIREGVSISREEMQQNMAEVAQMEPVATLGGDEFGKGDVDLVTQVAEYFDGLGGSVENPQLGMVTINRAGVQDSIAHGIGRLKAMAFYAVPDVLEKGKIIDYQKNWKGRMYDTFVLAAPIDVQSGRYAGQYYIGAIVMRNANTQRYYLHELITQERGNQPFKTRASLSSVLPGGQVPPKLTSILERVREINRSGGNETENSQLSESKANSDIRYSLFDETADGTQLLSENERLRRLHETFASKVGDVSRYKGESSREAADISSGKPTAHGGCLALRLRNSSGEQPMMARKVLWKKVVSLYPTRSATSLMGMAVLASRRQLALTRTCLTNSEKVTPISCLKCLLR